jgi:hypothetical protein
MHKLLRNTALGLTFASACIGVGAKPAHKQPAAKEYFSYSTETITTGVAVADDGDLCTISATWASKPGFALALPDVHVVQLRQSCETLAQLTLIEQTTTGWQPTLHAWALYRMGPSSYADLLKETAEPSKAGT